LVIDAVQIALDKGVSPELIPDYLIEQGVLKETIIGFDEKKMRVLYKRITNYLLTGE
jgi:hypothetical protein